MRLAISTVLIILCGLNCAAQTLSDATPPVPPVGWDFLPHTKAGGVMTTDDILHFYPSLTPLADSPIFFIFNGGGLTQMSDLDLSPNTKYTLTVGVGTRHEGTFGGFDFKVGTDSGLIIGEWIGANRNFVPPGAFANFTRTFTTGPDFPWQGEKLRITISQPVGSPANAYTDLTQVRLTSSKISNPSFAAQPIDVLIVAGQSNAHGWQANAADLSPENRHYADKPNPQALLSYCQRNLPDSLDNIGSMAEICPQGPGFASNFNGFGPELALGNDLADKTKQPVAIIKYAIGSAGLNAHFKKSTNLLYPKLIDFIASSLKQLRSEGYIPTIKAVFWLQGETDASDHAALYGQNIADFAGDLRRDLEEPDIEFFLTEINARMPSLSNNTQGVATVNQGMMDFAKKDPLVSYISIDDLTDGFADGIHYSANQQISIGQRWARAYLDHQNSSGQSSH